MKQISVFYNSYIGKILLLAGLYIITGKLGLMLAVPPGYATVIWPPSGIALGVLIMHGWRLWPGILLGSFILNCYISGAYSADVGFIASKLIVAVCIATGSTLQALAGYKLISHFIGLPLKLNHTKEILKLFILSGPIACLIAASVGIGTLYLSGVLPASAITTNWFTWLAGDIFGILIFLPLILVAPGSNNRIIWRGNLLSSLPITAMLVLLVPLGLTFYAWKFTSESIYEKNSAQFASLAIESEKALLHRLDSYENALLGGEGFIKSSSFVSREEWRSYVETLNIKENFPGINGIGLIDRVKPQDVQKYLNEVRKDGAPDFKIHPLISDQDSYVIKYVEPSGSNNKAMGLNIAFEENRRQAANLSLDTGKPAITRRIILVQDDKKSPGFLLLHPVYKLGMPTNTIEERREAFRVWVYAPFIASDFLKDLTNSQNNTLQIRIYDGESESPDALIYNSSNTNVSAAKPTFVVKKNLEVMQQKWFVIWESTLEYDVDQESLAPLFVLVSGFVLTGMLGMFLMITTLKQLKSMEAASGAKNFTLPVLVFIITITGSFILYKKLGNIELAYIKTLVEKEADKTELLLTSQSNDRLLALKRMAQRWEKSGGTSFDLWQDDSNNYIKSLKGLKAVEWVDSSYHVRWVEPVKGNEKAIGLNIIFDKKREEILRGAAERNSPTVTPPLDLVQGYKAFIVYTPIYIKKKFDGFMVGIFSINEFFNGGLTKYVNNNYRLSVSYDGQEFSLNKGNELKKADTLGSTRNIHLYDKKWILHITPTQKFIENQKTSFPIIILIAGFLIAALSSLTIRYILIARLRSIYLHTSKNRIQASEETFRSAMENASIGMALVDPKGRWLKINKSLCDLLGYEKLELLQNDFQSITHPDDLEKDLEYVRQMLAGEIKTYQMEKRYYHKNGKIVWVLLSVSLVLNNDGSPNYFVAQIQDITERKEMDRIKGEFISMVSHELRTPLTSIRGSLGLVLGALSKDLPEKVKGLLNIANNNSERLILLINDILDMDKIAAGQMRFDMQKESLADITQQAVEANQAYAEKFKTRIELKPIDKDINVNIDSVRYIQILSNLLSNAAKFSPEGKNIDVTTTKVANNIRISVRDYGAGIPEEFRSRIFGKFSQADSTSVRTQGGTGLGLHITKTMVEHMNGTVGFDTETNKGTTFWVEFPIISDEKIEIDDSERECEENTILICEDARDIAMIMQTMTENAGFKSDLAHSIAEAKALLKKNKYSAITVDNLLTDGDGIEFIAELCKNPDTKDLPMIVVSGNKRSDRPDISKDLKFDAWVEKPIDEKIFIKSLKDAINSKNTLPEILHIEDDMDLSNLLAVALQDKAKVTNAPTLAKAKKLLKNKQFSTIILDIGLPDGSGLEILEHMPELTTPIPPVLVLSASDVPERLRTKATEVIVKSRMSEIKIVEVILYLVEQYTKENK